MALGSLCEIQSCERDLLMVSLKGDGLREECHKTFGNEGLLPASFITIEQLRTPSIEFRFSSKGVSGRWSFRRRGLVIIVVVVSTRGLISKCGGDMWGHWGNWRTLRRFSSRWGTGRGSSFHMRYR